MKKTFIFLAAAAALVACSKNEETSYISPADNEINFLVAPKVKAETTPTFDRNWTFKSTAFYLPKAESWASHTTTPAEYIKGVDISYDTTDKVWRNATKKYYWPKDGKLTFFAWTSLKQGDNVTGTYDDTKKVVTLTENQEVSCLTSGVSVDATNGVKIENYDVTAAANKNYDLLVADIQADQTANNNGATVPKYNTNGVPTLFKHKLSQVFFSLQTKDGYDYETKDGITFTVNSIKFLGIDKKGTYTQGVDATACLGSWTSTTDAADQSYYEYATTETEKVKVTTTTTPLVGKNANQQYYYLPQDFAAQASGTTALTSDVFVVNYTIKYANGTEETISQECVLKNSDSDKTIFDKWEMGKRYTINLKFSLNEILWDPAVEDWEDVNKEVTVS